MPFMQGGKTNDTTATTDTSSTDDAVILGTGETGDDGILRPPPLVLTPDPGPPSGQPDPAVTSS